MVALVGDAVQPAAHDSRTAREGFRLRVCIDVFCEQRGIVAWKPAARNIRARVVRVPHPNAQQMFARIGDRPCVRIARFRSGGARLAADLVREGRQFFRRAALRRRPQHIARERGGIFGKGGRRGGLSLVDSAPLRVFDLADEGERCVFSSAGEGGVRPAQLGEGVPFRHAAQREREVFVALPQREAEPVEVALRPFESQFVEDAHGGHVAALGERAARGNISRVVLPIVGGGITAEVFLFVEDGRGGREQVFFDGGRIDGERFEQGARLAAHVPFRREPGEDAAALVLRDEQALARAVGVRAQLLGIVLQFRVHIGVDGVPAAHGVRRKHGQRFQLRKDGVEIALRAPAFGARLRERSGERRRIFLFGQKPEAAHTPQDAVAHGAAFFAVDQGGIAVGGADHGGERRAFRGVQRRGILPEVEVRRARDAVAGVPEIDRVQVHGQDLVLRIAPFQLPRQLDLFQLSPYRLFPAQVGIFDELLADRRRALPEGARAQIFQQGARHAAAVQPAMAVKIFVLRGDERLPHMVGQFFDARAAVGVFERNVGDLYAARVDDARGLLRRLQAFGLQAGAARHDQIICDADTRRRSRQPEQQGGHLPNDLHSASLYSIRIFAGIISWGRNFNYLKKSVENCII